MKNISKLSLFLSIILLTSGCSERLYKKGVKDYDQFAYYDAINNFEKYLLKHDKYDAKNRLANAYRLINDAPNAEKWYSKIVNLPESEPINMFYYAKTLMSVEKYEEATKWFNKYLEKVPDDFVAEMLLASCHSINSFKQDTTLFTLKEVEMPDVATSFGQTPYKNGIIFTGDKYEFRNSKKFNWTGRSYLDLYFSQKDKNGKWLSPVLLKGNINGQYHEGPACFNNTGNVVYFTRSNVTKKKLNKSSKSENNLKIFRAELVKDKWTNVTELPFNSDEYSCGHPCLSPDEKTLYFISDMPGGIGGTDIYRSTFDGANWSKPENLGEAVNTFGNEMFPYMHSDGTLYFSSDSRNNLGGLDVFMTSYDGKKWLRAENLNYPLNSSKDDFGYVLNKDNKTGFVSSNRSSEDKMYEVTKNDPTFILTGYTKRKGVVFMPLEDVTIEITNITDNKKETVVTDKAGNYKYKFKPNTEYVVGAVKTMFFCVTSPKKISTIGKKISENFTANFDLDEIIIEKPIVLENIYYDLDKWEIRPDAATELDRLVQVLKDNMKVKIEMSSHTDSRASDQYNLVLSDKRAEAAVQYLIANGIDAKRLKWKGYGETKILNRCKNGVECTEEEHQVNRRTEFKAIK